MYYSNSETHVGEQLHQGEDMVKSDTQMDGTEVPSQSSLIHKEAEHLDKDCQGISINVDSINLCPASTTADQEVKEFQPSAKEATENDLCNDMKESVGHQPQFDQSAKSAGITGHLEPGWISLSTDISL
jgi:hypothetical protein